MYEKDHTAQSVDKYVLSTPYVRASADIMLSM